MAGSKKNLDQLKSIIEANNLQSEDLDQMKSIIEANHLQEAYNTLHVDDRTPLSLETLPLLLQARTQKDPGRADEFHGAVAVLPSDNETDLTQEILSEIVKRVDHNTEGPKVREALTRTRVNLGNIRRMQHASEIFDFYTFILTWLAVAEVDAYTAEFVIKQLNELKGGNISPFDLGTPFYFSDLSLNRGYGTSSSLGESMFSNPFTALIGFVTSFFKTTSTPAPSPA